METKFFAEVFPTLNLNSDIKDLFGNVEVTRVTRNRANNAVRIYIKSNRLIEKNIIRNVENEIHSQVFENMPVKISIMEKFRLSGQYTPDRLYKVYRESILSELKDYSIIEYNMLNKAKYDFSEEGIMTLTTLDSPINRAKETELIRILEKIFCERCGIPVEVRIVYKKEDENKHENYSRQKIKLEVEAVMNNITDEKEELHESTEKEEEKKQTEKRVQKEEKTQPPAKNERTYTRSYKKSDNPDVLYGRDFDGEEIAISSIEGEMGEVIIHGKIIALDKREIRNEKTIIMFDITDFTDTITVKMFTGNDRLDEILPAVAKGSFIRLKGITTVDRFDSELTIASVSGIKKAGDFTTKRTDTSIEKRVELHCHTKMSDMDGVT
ncbi:MAG: PolC-type DNA polymerase III, partial [Lachnospiraceae bacterium]|nr:PolC-type DNA polymerase III [Lachnospiraceae bacterium]